MAYSRKNSGLGAIANHLIIVDENGSSVVDLGSSAVTQPTVDANCTYGSQTWAGVSRGYVETKNNGAFNFYGITWSANNPQLLHAATNGASMVIIGSPGATDGTYGSITGTSNWAAGFTRRTSGGAFNYEISTNDGRADLRSLTLTGNTNFSDKIILGIAGKAFGTIRSFADIDGGGESAYRFNTTDGWGLNSGGVLNNIGGFAGAGYHTFRLHCLVIFNDYLATLSDFQALRDDWFGQLVVSGDTTAPTYGVAPALALRTNSTATFTATASDETASTVDHYMAVYTAGSTPTAANVKAATGTGFVSSSNRSGSAVANGVAWIPSAITGLSAFTSYRAAFTVEEAGGGNLKAVTYVDFQTNKLYPRIRLPSRMLIRH